MEMSGLECQKGKNKNETVTMKKVVIKEDCGA
jgi:hypothetical protein